MQSEEKLALIIGASMVVIGTASLVIIDHIAQKNAKQNSEEYREVRMQQAWERIQRSHLFAALSPEEKVKVFDTFWKTQGGVKSHN